MTVAERVRDLSGRAVAWLQAWWWDFREESPYFQAKAGLVAGWIVISALTLWWVPPSPPLFRVDVSSHAFGLSDRVTIGIDNVDAGA
jgi:hypothetical protein